MLAGYRSFPSLKRRLKYSRANGHAEAKNCLEPLITTTTHVGPADATWMYTKSPRWQARPDRQHGGQDPNRPTVPMEEAGSKLPSASRMTWPSLENGVTKLKMGIKTDLLAPRRRIVLLPNIIGQGDIR